jgi:hypothetical protein
MRPKSPRPLNIEDHDVFESLLARGKEFLTRYLRVSLIGVAVVLGVVLVIVSYHSKLNSERAETWRVLSEMPVLNTMFLDEPSAAQVRKAVIEQCRQALKTRWKTDATPWVLLKLAATLQASRLFEESLAVYGQLEKEYPLHYATGLAAEGRAALLEEMGRFEEAARTYESLTGKGEYPRFWLDAARSWELAGNRDAALRAYREVTAAQQGVGPIELDMAQVRLKSLADGKPLLALPPPPPAPAPKELPGEGQRGAQEPKPTEPPSVKEGGQPAPVEKPPPTGKTGQEKPGDSP